MACRMQVHVPAGVGIVLPRRPNEEFALSRFLGFEWTGWSTTPMTLSIIALSWAITFLAVSLAAGLFGFGGVAGVAGEIAKGLGSLFVLLLTMSLVAGLVWRIPAGRPAPQGSRRP